MSIIRCLLAGTLFATLAFSQSETTNVVAQASIAPGLTPISGPNSSIETRSIPLTFPKFSGSPSTLLGVTVTLRAISSGGFLAVDSSCTSSASFVAQLNTTFSLVLPNGSSTSLNHNYSQPTAFDTQCIASALFPSQDIASFPVTIPVADLGTFAGVGDVTANINVSYSRSISLTAPSFVFGSFALQSSLVVSVTYESLSPFQNVGGGIAGQNGIPTIVALGTAEPNSTLTLLILNAAPSASGLIAFAPASSQGANILTGFLHPFPNPAVVGIDTLPAGTSVFNALIPAALPPGTQLVSQALIVDPLAPTCCIALTDGLEITIQ